MTLEKQEIRILKPKISEEKIDSFFYCGSIAHGIRSDGTVLLLAVHGDIRIKINDEDYDNETKGKAIDKYDLTDRKMEELEKEAILIWDNNNWFEIIWTKDGMDHWESVSGAVRYDYDSAIQLFEDYYNRKELNI